MQRDCSAAPAIGAGEILAVQIQACWIAMSSVLMNLVSDSQKTFRDLLFFGGIFIAFLRSFLSQDKLGSCLFLLILLLRVFSWLIGS